MGQIACHAQAHVAATNDQYALLTEAAGQGTERALV